jgi:hypothetical protein
MQTRMRSRNQSMWICYQTNADAMESRDASSGSLKYDEADKSALNLETTLTATLTLVRWFYDDSGLSYVCSYDNTASHVSTCRNC